MIATDPRINDPLRLFERDPDTCATELAADLSATWSSPLTTAKHDDWMSRPSILRRVAAALADGISGGTERIACVGAGSEVLGAAVSLATGIPFVAIEDANVHFGTVHPGERVAVMSVRPVDEAVLADFARIHGVEIESVQAVLAHVQHPPRGRTLFTADDQNGIAAYGRTH